MSVLSPFFPSLFVNNHFFINKHVLGDDAMMRVARRRLCNYVAFRNSSNLQFLAADMGVQQDRHLGTRSAFSRRGL